MKSQIWQHPLEAATQALKNMLTILTQPSGGKITQEVFAIQGFLDKKIDIGEIDQKNEKIINLGEPTSAKDAATKDFVEKSHFPKAGCNKMYFCIRC